MSEQPADSHKLLSAEQIEGDFAYISGLGVDADDLVEITDEDMAQMLKARHQWAEMGKQNGGFDHTINRDFVLIENAQPFRGNVRRHVCAIRYGTTWLLEGLTR